MGARRPLAWIACAIALSVAGDGALAEVAGRAKRAPHAFDPRTVALGDRAPETLVLAALGRGAREEARRAAARALPRARGDARGRLRWLLAKASDDEALAQAQLEALWKSGHALRRWAGLELAERLRRSDATRAGELVAALRDGWTGAPRARALQAKLAPPRASGGAPAGAPPPSPSAELARGEALLTARQYEKAEELFSALTARPDLDAALRCEVQLAHGRALAYRKVRKEAAELLAKVATECEEPEVKVWARYHAGRAFLRSGAPSDAITQYDALRREAPGHSLADDALLAEAVAREDTGDAEGARVALTSLLERYPGGDMRGEARSRLAFAARAAGAHEEALAHFQALATEPGADELEGAEGRASYWQARSLEALGRRDDAVRTYEELARAQPLSFHAQHALARLRKLRPARMRALVRELSQGPAGRPMRFRDRPELARPELATAIELLRVGEARYALEELAALGLTAEGADDEGIWIVAALLHHAGAYPEALGLVRKRLDAFRSELPRGEAHGRWRIGYPRAFAPLVEKAARESAVPAAFVRAVAREESSFLPEAVSPARAYGLVQLLEPTARRYAEPLRLPSDPTALARPEVNLRIGARFMRESWRRYGGNAALVPAAYNAGVAAVDRWLVERPDMEVDEWIERIPYTETRRYTRRVLQSYVAYSWLDGGELPEWSMRLPARR